MLKKIFLWTNFWNYIFLEFFLVFFIQLFKKARKIMFKFFIYWYFKETSFWRTMSITEIRNRSSIPSVSISYFPFLL
ncbi:unnamed protein product [Blepharisma stoltei]|uniref:Uncharacterized protein n=1 Tax=Blepharisma stoltei TaxID=1481888 RepID=A0AAU9IPI1_9CILI|nr:unnamed protein product [Blepharisma stoltei]